MTDYRIPLVMAEAKHVINPADSLEDRCRAAMKACYRHWMVTDEGMQFKGAIAAVYVATDDEDEKDRIEVELNSLRDLSALLSGVRVDPDSIHRPENPIGLRKMWMDIVDSSVR